MHLRIPAVEGAHLAEARNAACQDSSLPIFLGFDKYGPVFCFPPFSLSTRRRDTSWPGHIEDEEAAGNESFMDTAEQPKESSEGIAAIEDVVKTLSDCGDCDAGRELG